MPGVIPGFRRVLNRDGTFNTSRIGVKRRFLSDSYHILLTISWPKCLALFALGYLLTNLLFGSLYYLCGQGAIDGLTNADPFTHFWECFFFSVQTLATIGYGKLAPASLCAHALVTIEALVGLFFLALSTGLFFSRFSRPTARVAMSNRALIYSHNGTPTLFIRIANERTNQIVDASVNVIHVTTITTKEGEIFRKINDLKLVRSRSPIFAATWTVMHPITEDSPLYGLTAERMRETDMEILVSFTGLDDTLNQPVHTRYSYSSDEILTNHRFVDMLGWNDDGSARIDLTKIHETVPVA